MRIIWRLLLILTVIVLALAFAGYVFRGPIAGAGLRTAMARAGLEKPALDVETVSLSALHIRNLRAGASPGADDLDIARLHLEYDWRALLFRREIKALEIGPGRVRARLDADGAIKVAGLNIPQGDAARPGGTAVVIEAIRIEGLEARFADHEGGAASASVSGEFEPGSGGVFSAEASGEALTLRALRLGDFDLQTEVTLAADGSVDVDANARGDLASAAGAIDNLDLYAEATGFSWRAPLSGGVGLAGEGRLPDRRLTLDIRSGDLAVDAAPELSSLTAAEAATTGRPAIRRLTVSGGFAVAIEDGAVSARAADGPALSVRSDRDDLLTIAGVDGAPLFTVDGENREVGLAAALAGETATGSARIFASKAANEAWNFDLTADLLDPSLADFALGATALKATGQADGERILGDLDIATMLKRVDLGRFVIKEAPFSAILRVDAALGARELEVSTRDGGCLDLDEARFSLDDQKMRASLDGARLCAADEGPLLLYRGSEPKRALVSGVLSAESGAVRWGETRLDGAPPQIRFRAAYDPAAHGAQVAGEISGGRVVLNEAFEIARPAGTFSARLNGAAPTGDLDLASVVVSEARDAKRVATMVARGDGAFAENVFSFGYSVSTLEGALIGVGEGVHAVSTGEGSARVRSADLSFAEGRFQPDDLLPLLKGIVWRARGGVSATAEVAWSPDKDFRSSAAMELSALSFRGPGVAVSETVGVSGDVALSALSPPRTGKPQSISIERVDLGALVLENGDVMFELPGDDTLRVVSAAFPWFGGEIGAYDTVAAMTGGQATTRLEAKNVDLGQLLSFWEIEGLSGEGVVEGVLPLVIEDGRARIEKGRLSAVGPGVIRYAGDATDAASGANDQAALAFDVLRNLRFETLTAEISGPLDGDLSFDLLFEGVNEIPIGDPRVREPVSAPIIYRIRLNAPLLTLLNNARNAVDPQFLLEQIQSLSVEGEIVSEAGGETP